MKFIFSKPQNSSEILQEKLFYIAALFLLVTSIGLTFSTAARLQTWTVSFRWGHWLGYFIWLICFFILIRISNHFLPEHDPFILPIVSLLTGWGLLTIWRLTTGFGIRQTLWLLICTTVLIFILRIPNFLQLLRKYKYIWLSTGIILMLLTFVIGVYPGGEGPRLWLGFGGVYLQPSEPIKLLLLVFLAAYLADHLPISFSFIRLILPSLIMFSIALTVLLAQRDLGTASIFIVLYFSIIFLGSSKRRMIIVGVVFLLISAFAGYYLFQVIHLRVDAWLNPWVDPSGSSYQIIQAMLAFAAGGLIGRGIGMGSPSLVPVPHSDFIAAAIGEEFGLAGIIAILCLLAIIIIRGFRASIHAKSLYHRFLAAGITILIVGQSILIMGGNLRLLPLTGVTLPFMSYGGSSLLTSLIALLFILIISSEKTEEPILMERPRAFQFIGGSLILGLFGLALSAGWWSVIRSGDLQTRLDNPRLSIGERYSPRGNIVDHENELIVSTEGEIGNLQRVYLFPSMSPITGYDDPVYGEAGLESSMDAILRGETGNASSTIWWHHLLYGQSPPGLDVRLSIDIETQKLSDSLLENHVGAIILMNSQSGEVIGLSSFPWIDPNHVSEKWGDWINDETSPFINRATQSQYIAGKALGIFLLSQYKDIMLSDLNVSTTTFGSEILDDCSFDQTTNMTIYEKVRMGCSSAIQNLIVDFSFERLNHMLSSFGLLEQPEFSLPTSLPYFINNDLSLYSILFGDSQITVSPLQMSRAAAVLNNYGQLISPKLVLAFSNPQQDWLAFSNPEPVDTRFTNSDQFIMKLDNGSGFFWESVVRVESQIQGIITWYIGGTQPQNESLPYVVVVALEEDNPALAKSIGNSLLESIYDQ